jgi:chromosomal replication initiator protein
MYLCRELTRSSLPAIGRAFGGRDHATVHYALRRVGQRMHDDPQVADTLSELTELIAAREADRNC